MKPVQTPASALTTTAAATPVRPRQNPTAPKEDEPLSAAVPTSKRTSKKPSKQERRDAQLARELAVKYEPTNTPPATEAGVKIEGEGTPAITATVAATTTATEAPSRFDQFITSPGKLCANTWRNFRRGQGTHLAGSPLRRQVANTGATATPPASPAPTTETVTPQAPALKTRSGLSLRVTA
jgi:hypothetical protein